MQKKPLFTQEGRLVSQIDYQAVLESYQKAVISHGMKAVAKGIGYSYEQLRRISDPYPNPDEIRHLRVDKMIETIEATGDISVLAEIAGQFGYRLESIYSEPDQPTSMREAAQDVDKMGARNNAMLEWQPPSVVEARNNELIDDCLQTLTAYRQEYAEYQQGHVMRGGKWEQAGGRQ